MYQDGCAPGATQKDYIVSDLFAGGFARVAAWVGGLQDPADVAVQAEADLLFINSHHDDDIGFYTFHDTIGDEPYPGACNFKFLWSQMAELGEDCNWITVTGCESLDDGPYGWVDAQQLLLNSPVYSVAGSAGRNQWMLYDVITGTYNCLLNCCVPANGEYHDYLWLVPPINPTWIDCNVIAWMEAYCDSARDELDGPHNPPDAIPLGASARALDSQHLYKIMKRTKTTLWLWFIEHNEENWYIVKN